MNFFHNVLICDMEDLILLKVLSFFFLFPKSIQSMLNLKLNMI